MNAKNTKKIRVAILDKSGRLVGEKMVVGRLLTGEIEAGDLPIDGSYKWTGTEFIPLGHGHGKPSNPPVTMAHAVYLMMRAMVNGQPIPQECADWCAWYERSGLAEKEGR